MLRPPSLQEKHPVCWSRDPAFALPELSAQEGDDAAREAWADWDRRFASAREAGQLSSLVRAGERPTVFQMIPMPSRAFRAITDGHAAERIGSERATALAFRACVRGVEDLQEGFDLGFVDDPEYGRLAAEKVVDLLDAVSPSIVREIGWYCFKRASSPPPKR